MLNLSAFWKQEKARTKTEKKSLSRTDELEKLFDSFMDDFYGAEGDIGIEKALDLASYKLRQNIDRTTQQYRRQVQGPRKEYFEEARGDISDLYKTTGGRYDTAYGGLSDLAKTIATTQAGREPIDIGFGGNKIMTMTPYEQATNQQLAGLYGQMGDVAGASGSMLSDLLSQRTGLESDYLSGTSGDVQYLKELADAKTQANLMPSTTMMDYYEKLMLPMELARIGEYISERTKGTDTSYGASAGTGTNSSSFFQ